MTTTHAQADLLDVMTGSPKEIGRRLNQLDADQVVAIGLEHVSAKEAGAIAETLVRFVQLVGLTVSRHERETLESLVEILVPRAPPTPTQLKEAAMLARARTAVLQEDNWLTTAQIADLAGFSTSNPSAQPNKWKRDRLIFAIRHRGVDYFPSYGLDPKTGFRPLKVMAKVIETFGESKDGWGLAYWFSSANSFLGGKRPQDVLAKQPDRVIAAAADEQEAVAHG
ncbi:hypothetical protein C7T35_33830 [Variovorax sp. WS11]|uniref:hypothetical protein n=1 Tax=Variovorax sp. WS11 TaxID=1105204 RepID=UPI000D0D59DF|nr:hypothetical protein [Variovorax sp. WS11]NDZ13833.1 hypothetical protein [Variovorax sp. WS11]PSL80165.1 hypothetical protein C7T35_33830 [Variovorax sp. WS11]